MTKIAKTEYAHSLNFTQNVKGLISFSGHIRFDNGDEYLKQIAWLEEALAAMQHRFRANGHKLAADEGGGNNGD